MSKTGYHFDLMISKSFKRTWLMLFKPFSLKKWIALLFIAGMAGALGVGGHFNLGSFNREKEAEAYPVRGRMPSQSQELRAPRGVLQENEFNGPNGYSQLNFVLEEGTLSVSQEAGRQGRRKWEDFFNSKVILVAAILSLFVGLPIFLLFAWLSARFKFIWYEAVINNDASIVAPFEKYRKEGNSLFGFFIVYMISYWACTIALGLWSYFLAVGEGVFHEGFSWSVVLFFKLFGVQLGLFVFLNFVSFLILFLIDHFLVPIMAIDGGPVLLGIKNFGRLYQDNQKNFWMFLLLNLGLSLLSGVLSMIMIMMLFLIFAIAGLLVFGLLYLGLVAWLEMKIVFVVLAGVLGIPFLIVNVLLISSLGLPFALFFRNLSLYFLSSLDCRYGLLPFNVSPPEPADGAGS